MEHEISREKTSVEDFDFLSRRTTQEPTRPKINLERFLNVGKGTMIAAGISLAVGVTAIGGYKLHQSNIDSRIAAAETVVKASTADKLIGFIGKEKIANEKTYIANQLLINQYGQLKDVVEVLNKQQEVANYQTRNTQVYNTIAKSLNADILAVNSLFATKPVTRDQKIAAYLDNDNIKVAKKWEDAITTNQFVHVGNMMDLNKQIKGSVDNIEQVKKDILEQVQSRIKNGDFDLNAAQSQFSNTVINQTQSQLNELNQAKKDLSELKNQSVKNEDGSITRTDPNAQNIISDKDLNEASDALNTYQNQAINQISGDRAKVEQLIAEAKQQNTPQPVQNTANTTTNPNSNVVVVNRGPSFLDYYLMYSWMNAASSNTVHHHYHDSPSSSNRYGYSGNNSSYNNTQPRSAQVNTANYKPVNIPKPNMYDMNNNNSYLNKQLERGSTFGNKNNSFGKSSEALKKVQQYQQSKVNISEIRSKIAASKMKVEQAKSVKANEMRKIETAKTNKYEAIAEKARKSSASSTSNSSNKSSSSGGFSKPSKSFGSSSGSRSFGRSSSSGGSR